MKTNKPRRFADDEIDQLRERLADYVMRCDPDSLRQLAGALPEDFDEGALVPDTDNIPAQGASGDLAANAERRVRRYAEQIFHHVQKFSERNAEVEKVVALWRKSGQDVNEFLPRGA